jgi:coenzyme F420-reducing hydrogenase gamma subunit
MTRQHLNLLWLQSGGCGGCTLSLLNAEQPHLYAHLEQAGIRLLWHPSLSTASGGEVRQLLADCVEGRERLDILCVEGSLLTGPNGTGRFHMLSGSGRPMIEWVRQLAARARNVVAVGSCAAFGGITATGGNPSGAVGLQYDGNQPGGLLGQGFRSHSGLPVINVAGCPTHPGWVLDTLLALALDRFSSDRPRPTAAAALLRRSSGASRLPAQRVLRVQGQRGKALRSGLHDGTHGLQGHPGARRLQHPLVERRRFLPARRLSPASVAPNRISRNPAIPSPKRRRSPASPSACPRTCRRPGSSPLPRCPNPRRRSGCAKTRWRITPSSHLR